MWLLTFKLSEGAIFDSFDTIIWFIDINFGSYVGSRSDFRSCADFDFFKIDSSGEGLD